MKLLPILGSYFTLTAKNLKLKLFTQWNLKFFQDKIWKSGCSQLSTIWYYRYIFRVGRITRLLLSVPSARLFRRTFHLDHLQGKALPWRASLQTLPQTLHPLAHLQGRTAFTSAMESLLSGSKIQNIVKKIISMKFFLKSILRRYMKSLKMHNSLLSSPLKNSKDMSSLKTSIHKLNFEKLIFL